MTTRRRCLQSLGAASLAVAYANTLSANLIGQRSLNEWMVQLKSAASKLSDREISGLQWQELMDGVYADTPIEELKTNLAFERLKGVIESKIDPKRGEFFETVQLDKSVGLGRFQKDEIRQALITKVAHVQKGRSVPPHGHSNMVSAFLCVSGEFEVRLYDRLEESDSRMVVRRANHNESAGVGTWSSISDYRDNVHWLTAKTDDCYLFTCKILSVEKDRPLNGRINLDLKRANQIGSETYSARKITAAQAAELY